MSIAEDLEIKLENNQHTLFITDADDLLAVWQFKRKIHSSAALILPGCPKSGVARHRLMKKVP